MSTATAFKFHQPFPLCLPEIIFDNNCVNNLTLAQVMQWWWNMESLHFDVDATASTTAGGGGAWSLVGSVGVNPWVSTGDFSDIVSVRFGGFGAANSSMFAASGGFVSPGSLPGVWTPRERVCVASNTVHRVETSSDPLFSRFSIDTTVGLDPDNPGKYTARCAFNFGTYRTGGGSPVLSFFPWKTTWPGVVTVFGSVNIGGLDFSMGWHFDEQTPDSISISVSATTGFFTY